MRRFNAAVTLGWFLMSVLLLNLCGCGSGATIKGNVSYQGRPVRHGSVILHSADRTAHSGVIGPDGSYTVEKVPQGSVKIAVISRNPSKGRSTLRGAETTGKKAKGPGPQPAAVEGWFPLPGKFESPQTSGLRCAVDSRNVTYDIELN